MSNTEPDTEVVFYTRAYKKGMIYWYFILAVCVGAVIYLLPSLFHDYSFLPMYLLVICVCLYDAAFYYQLLRKTRLIISNSGIKYYGLKFQLTTSWDDLDLARNRTILSLFSPVRLTSKKPLIKRNLIFDWDLDTLWGKA